MNITVTLMTWGFSICATGFFFLALWIRQVADKHLLDELKEIRVALVGDTIKPGVLTILHRHEDQLRCIQANCKERHNLPA